MVAQWVPMLDPVIVRVIAAELPGVRVTLDEFN